MLVLHIAILGFLEKEVVHSCLTNNVWQRIKYLTMSSIFRVNDPNLLSASL